MAGFCARTGARAKVQTRLTRIGHIDEVEKSLLRTDLDIAKYYAGLVAETDVRGKIFALIETE